jgi:hypothetical protein
MTVQLKPERRVKALNILQRTSFLKTDENKITSESDRYFVINPSSISQSISLPSSVEPIKNKGGGQIRMEWPIPIKLFDSKGINAVEKMDKEKQTKNSGSDNSSTSNYCNRCSYPRMGSNSSINNPSTEQLEFPINHFLFLLLPVFIQ